MRINPDALRAPALNERGEALVEVRYVRDGKTVSMMVNVEGIDFNGAAGIFNITRGTIVGADFSTMTDGQQENQRRSIDRLLEHLKNDCPELSGVPGRCTYRVFTEDGS